MKINVHFIFFIAFCLFSLDSFSQITLRGVILNEATNEPIPFANIGVAKKNQGTVSNENGTFELPIQDFEKEDTLKISYLGFNSVNISHDRLDSLLKSGEELRVHLSPGTFLLDEITVSNLSGKPGKTVFSGNGKGRRRIKAGMGQGDMLGSELGSLIKNPGSFSKLKKVFLSIGLNNYKTFRVRINIYGYDGIEPTTPLFHKEILTEIPRGQKGIFEVDVASYEIYLESDFIVSVEYIEDMGEYGFYFRSSLNKNPCFYRTASQGSWKKLTHEGKYVSLGIETLLEVYN